MFFKRVDGKCRITFKAIMRNTVLGCSLIISIGYMSGCTRIPGTSTTPPNIIEEQPRWAAYRDMARAFAEEMITHGTDRYGWATSPQFATMLMRTYPPTLPPDPVFLTDPKPGQSRSMVENLPNIYKGANRAHKITYRGGDVADDAGLYQLLYAMGKEPGGERYKAAADASIQWFLANTPMHNGLLPWGEHTGWDFRREHFDYGYPYDKKHEFAGSWPLWERFFALQPHGGEGSTTVMERYARGVWKGAIGYQDGKLVYCRHASLVDFERPTYGEWALYGMFPRHGGNYLELWSIALVRSHNTEFREWMAPRIGQFLSALAGQIAAHGYPIYHFRGDENIFNGPQVASMAVDLVEASHRLQRDYPTLALEALRLAGLSQETLITRRANLRAEELYRLWQLNEGSPNTAKRAAYFRTQLIALADSLAALPVLPERPIKEKVVGQTQSGRIPEQYAKTIDALLLAAQSKAGRGAAFYLEHASRFAQEAMGMFIDGDSPLPKSLDRVPMLLDGTPFPAFYHSYLGGDDLMWSFWRLAKALEKVKGGRP